MKIAATMVSMDAAQIYTEVAIRHPGSFPDTPITDQPSPSRGNFNERFSSLLSTIDSESSVSPLTGPDATATAVDKGDEAEVPDQEPLAVSLTSALLGHSVSVQSLSTSTTASLTSGGGSLLYAGSASITSVNVYTRQEVVQYSAVGTVQTEDGRNIDFQLGVELQKSVSMVNTRTTRLPAFIDPLVLNFGTGIPFSGEASFTFDLDGDGDNERISSPGCGCGFLALDRNMDGMINNGLELFGPRTGFGFEELALFDEDANLWIDENDPVFGLLSIWMQDETGGERLLSLEEAGVGAISVAHAGGRFILEDGQGNPVGNVRANGIFLTEDGQVRSLQEIDLADLDGDPGIDFDSGEMARSWNNAIETFREIVDDQRFQLRMLLARRRAAAVSNRLVERLMHHVSTGTGDKGESETENSLSRIIDSSGNSGAEAT